MFATASALRPLAPVGTFFTGILLLTAFVTAAGAESSDTTGTNRTLPARILFIASYHPAFPSFFEQIDGFRKGMRENGFGAEEFVLDVEFLDSKRFPIAERSRLLESDLRRKIEHLNQYDLIVTADDSALRFAIDRRDTLFAGRNIVFLGVNDAGLAAAQMTIRA